MKFVFPSIKRMNYPTSRKYLIYLKYQRNIWFKEISETFLIATLQKRTIFDKFRHSPTISDKMQQMRHPKKKRLQNVIKVISKKKKIDIVKMYRKSNDTSTLFQNTFWKHKKNDFEGLFYQMNTNSQTIRKQVSKCLKNIRFQLYKRKTNPLPFNDEKYFKNQHPPPTYKHTNWFFSWVFWKILVFPLYFKEKPRFQKYLW